MFRLSILVGLIILAACQKQSRGSTKPISAASLSADYEKSRDEVRRTYDGKEIVVTGYAVTAASLPKPGEDQGFLSLSEKDRKGAYQLNCWFTRDQAGFFSDARPGQQVTVSGVFSGEAGMQLRFCRLVKIE